MAKADIAIIHSLEDLKVQKNLCAFEMIISDAPKRDLLQKLCIEIASHTPDADMDSREEGRVNPKVGALVIQATDDGFHIYGASRSAFHEGEHGECGLLTGILRNHKVDGCEMYVSLEPCTQESRHEWTEPCCEIIKNRRIGKVNIGMLDPNPDVAGQGLSYLVKNEVKVSLFDPEFQKEVRAANALFSEQFSDDNDPRLSRKIARILDSYVSAEAVMYFMKSCHNELDVPFYKDRYADTKKIFYRIMIENRSIIDGKSKLLPFDVIDEFALFFYKRPYHTVDAATIRYVFDIGGDSSESDPEDYDFNSPYAYAFEAYNKENSAEAIGNGFVEMLGKRYFNGQTKTKKELNSLGHEFIKGKFGEKGFEVIREAFVNAIIHRDYHENHCFTRIVMRDDCIEIFNPVSRCLGDYDSLCVDFKNMDVPSRPVNPKLMRYFQLIEMCERNGSGMISLKRSHLIQMVLGSDYILKTSIQFKQSH